MLWPLLAGLALAAADVPPITKPEMVCPDSPKASVHASTRLEVTAAAPCAVVKAEIMARTAILQHAWHDPRNCDSRCRDSRNSGSGRLSRYRLDQYTLADSPATLRLTRATEDQPAGEEYAEKLVLTMVDRTSGGCAIAGCSESQGTPTHPGLSTNYCNLRLLYCGSADGCAYVKHDFASATYCFAF